MYTSNDEIDYIGLRLMMRSLPKHRWTHEAHVAAAVWILESDAHNAETDLPPMIRRYNVSVGTANTDTTGYHETITLASLRRIAVSLAALPHDLACYKKVNAVLAEGLAKPDWIFRHWSREKLFSIEARHNWVEPDLAPLPTFPSAAPSAGAGRE